MKVLRKLLIIDDDDEDRQSLLDALDAIIPETSFQEARNGKEGLSRLGESGPKPDLIFLDLNMPLMNGIEFLKVISDHLEYRTIPVVVLSTSPNVPALEEWNKRGDIQYVIKPDTDDKMLTKIRQVLLKFFSSEEGLRIGV